LIEKISKKHRETNFKNSMNIAKIKKIFNSPATLSFLLVIQIILHLFHFKVQEFDLPQATKKLIISTIKNELVIDAKTKEVKNLGNVLDEISYASQLGRLDTISLLLTMFGLVLGLGAVVGFLGIKETSRLIAEQQTTDYLKESGKKMIEDFLHKNLPAIIEKYEAEKEAGLSSDKKDSLPDGLVNEMIQHLDDKINNKN